jgi:hypothetical protein
MARSLVRALRGPAATRDDAYARFARDALGLDIHGLFLLSVLHAPNTKAGVNPWVKFGGRKNPASTL